MVDINVNGTFRNIYIYVADALRYDFVPPDTCDNLDVIKTVAGGSLSPPSFATLITGRYPIEHGVFSFSDKLSEEIPTIFDSFPSLNTGFYRGGGELGKVLGSNYNELTNKLELDEPFLIMERDLLTHSPYGKDANHLLPEANQKYWESVYHDRSKIIQDYRRASELTIERFKKRINRLDKKNILEDTLVILTSDHGEFLGEYGLVGHGQSITPEISYVPTIIYNPNLKINQKVIGHTDIFKIISKALDSTKNAPQNALDQIENPIDMKNTYVCMSKNPNMMGVWGASGGYVFIEEKVLSRTKWGLMKCRVGYTKKYHIRHLLSVFKHGYAGIFHQPIIYGNPQFESSDAENLRKEISDIGTRQARRSLSEHSKKRLKELGYVEEVWNDEN